MQFGKAADEIVEIGRRLWLRGYVAANDGNISQRVAEDRLLATPTGVSKGFLTSKMLVLTDMDGKIVHGELRPSSELNMHLEVYRLRPEIVAVVHAHPPVATSFSVAGIALDKCVLPESVLTLGAIPMAGYATPSTDEMPASIRPFVSNHDALLLANHGAVSWATSLEQAYFRMETLEQSAAIVHHALMLGNVNLLGPGDIAKLEVVGEKLGLGKRTLTCETDGSCAPERHAPGPNADEQLVETITRAVIEEISKT
jgi:L-fuculose-phosphate aldolase